MAISRSAYRRYKVIDSLLRNTSRPYPSINDIQDACTIKLDMTPSIDTIEKDIRNMKMPEPDGLDAPIVYCRTNKGYYYTNPKYSINSVGLTDTDIDSIKEALDLVKNIGGSKVSIRFKQAIDKILTSYKEEFPESDSNRILIQTDYVNGSRGFKHFDILFSACKNRYPISFSHYSFQKRAFKSVIIHPVLLKEFDNRWYIVGYSENHQSLRTFGFDRIYEPLHLKRKYITTKQEEIDLYCNDTYGVYPYANEAKQSVIFKTTPLITNYFESYPIHSSQKGLKNEYGYCDFTLDIVPTVELVRLFRSYGTEITVKAPSWLQKEIKKV